MVGCCSPVKLQPHPFGVMRKCKRMSGKCNSAAVYLAPMGGNFNQRVSGWRNREKEQAQESSCESKVTASPPSTQASRRPGSRPHRLQRIHHPVPPPEQAAQQSRTQPPCQKAALQLHILLQRRHTSPQIPEKLWSFFQKPVLSARRAIDTSHTSAGIGLKLVLTLRLFQPKPRVFRWEAAGGRTVGVDGGCLPAFCLQRLPATFLGRRIRIQAISFL